jgi:hypothetical protein
MSAENVETVRRAADSFNRRDIAAVLDDFDEEFRAGKVVRVRILGTREEALEAAGISE